MSSTTELAAKLSMLEAIPHNQITHPILPIKQFLQEAETLHGWCPKDREALEDAGLNWALVEDLPARIGALREAQSNWFTERHSQEVAEQQWNEKSPAAYELRDNLLRDMRFAYRNDPTLMRRVAEISEGTGHADMVQDLNDLALFGRKHLTPLMAIKKFKPETLDLANEMSDEMGNLLGLMLGDRMENSAAKLLRDRAYTYLKMAIDDIRAHGQYAFWNQPERRIGYTSSYFRKSGKSTTDATPTPEDISESQAESSAV